MHLFLITFLFLMGSAWAHQSSLSNSGAELFWSNRNIPLVIQTSTSDMSSASARTIILNSINEWNQSSSAKINAVGSGNNEIRFVSNFPYGSAVVGITEVSFNNTGAIQKAVISLNDDYLFVSTPGLYPTGQIYLGDVVTHELGHVYGLSHSEVLNASMFYSSFSGQSTVAFDDQTGLRQKYDASYGKISGHVKGGNSIGVFGVHVQAISMKSGQASAVISDENGYFELGGLDVGDTYYLYTSPLKKVSSMPGIYSNVQNNYCPANYVGSFFSACGRENEGLPQGISLTSASSSVDVGTVTINCTLKTQQEYSLRKLDASFDPVTVYDYGLESKVEKSYVGFFRKTTSTAWSLPDHLKIDLTHYSSLSGNPKFLKVALVSYPFGNQLQYEMDIEQDGVNVASAHRALSYSAVTETYATDFESFIALDSDASKNNFEVSLKSKKLGSSYSAQTFPSFVQFSTDQYLPYLMSMSVWELTGAGLMPVASSVSSLSDNDSCLEAPFTYAVSHARNLSDESDAASAQTAAAACGTIDPPDAGPGSSTPLMALGFLVAFLPVLLSKSQKKFLS